MTTTASTETVTIRGTRLAGPAGRYRVLKNQALFDVLYRCDYSGFNKTDSRRGKFRALWPLFEESLGDMAPSIRSEEDFNAATFLRQADFIRGMACSTPEEKEVRDLFCSTVPVIYRYVEKAVGRPVFGERAAVTPYLLSCPQLSTFLRRGAAFCTWSHDLEYDPGRDYYVITVFGFDALSTRMKAVDYVGVDLTPVPEGLRPVFFGYLVSTPSRIVALHGSSFVRTLVDVTSEYLALKKEPGYPNPDPRVMTRTEMDHMRNVIIDRYPVPETANSHLRMFRDFARWAISRGIVEGPASHLKTLRYTREAGKGRGESIPADHFNRIMERMRTLAEDSGLHACCYVALRLLALTKLRVSSLCSLRRSCLEQTADHGVWQVVAPSKTSGAGRERDTVSEAERRAIESLAAATEPLREELAGRPERDYLFLFRGRSGIRMLDSGTLNRTLRRVCDEIGVERYQSHNIRSCRQTRAARFAEKAGLSLQDTELLTGHVNRETTMNSYMSVSASDYHAALYGVMTEDVQKAVAGTVVADLPGDAEPAAGDGARLGACAKDSVCTARTLLPCLTCRHFVTDVHHLRLFEQAVEDIDRRIMEAEVPHDKEDLVTVKEIYVVYINRIKEVICKSAR